MSGASVPTTPGTWFMATVDVPLGGAHCIIVVTDRVKLIQGHPRGGSAVYAATRETDGQQFLVTDETIDASSVTPVLNWRTVSTR